MRRKSMPMPGFTPQCIGVFGAIDHRPPLRSTVLLAEAQVCQDSSGIVIKPDRMM